MTGEVSEVEAGIRLASACCVAYILRSCGGKFDHYLIITLVKSLLLKPDAANEKCAAYDQLVNVYLTSRHWWRFVVLVLYTWWAKNWTSYH